MNKAVIFGVTGQDGSYLSELLLDKGYYVIGVARRSSVDNTGRLSKVVNHENFQIVEGDLTDSGCVRHIISHFEPEECYNLAAQSHVGTSFQQPGFTFQVNTMGVLHILDAIKDSSPKTKFYQASTSEMFGNNYKCRRTSLNLDEMYQDETVQLKPCSPYAIAKVAAHNLVQNYRESYDLFVCAGILFNHESPRRGENFVTRKITKWIGEFSNWLKEHSLDEYDAQKLVPCDIAKEVYIPGRTSVEQGFQFPMLKLGNIDAKRDWGYAPDYVEAMWMMLQQDKPEDYVISTGKTYSVRDFLTEAFKCIGIQDWTPYVKCDHLLLRPNDVKYLLGDSSKARHELKWEPKTDFAELVKIMVEADIALSQQRKVHEMA